MNQPLDILPGTAAAKYGLPIDHPPSGDFRARWGNARPPIASLYKWFTAHATEYDDFLDEMGREATALAAIPRRAAEAPRPEPAWFGGPYAPFDMLALCTMIRLRRPQTYLEIGSGMATCFAARAVRDNGLATRIVALDPEPIPAIAEICDEVIREGLQTCDLARFEALDAGDIVFFDGSHRCFMNSDVTVFMIDVLPRLKPGVVVHVHDVTLPWDYSPLFHDRYWNEQYILASYLIAASDRLDPLLPTSFICREARFAARFARPFVDFGDANLNARWRGGRSMWFTHKANARADAVSAATAPDAAVTPAAPPDPLAARIQRLRERCQADLPPPEVARLAEEIREVLHDDVFNTWSVEWQMPMVQQVNAFYTWYHHPSGHSLIATLETLFRRALAAPGVTLDALCLYYDLLYFLYWYVASDFEAMRGIADSVMKPFAAAIRAGAARGLPAIRERPLGRAPLRLGYLAQFARLGNPIGPCAHAVLGGLSRHLPGTYRLFLYAWSEHDDESLAALAGTDIQVRRFSVEPTSERIAAVAQAIAADGIDILITDMNTALPAVLFERRVAPVQIFFQVTLPFWPIANVDGAFLIDFPEPEWQAFRPEQWFEIGLGPWDRPEYAPPVDPARVKAERSRFPPSAKIIGTFVRFAKITAQYLEIAGELLARHADLVVAIGGTGDATLIRDFIARRGLTGRLVLIEGYVDGHVWGHMLDVFLDTFPIPGGVAGREVMTKGRPVVAMRLPWCDGERLPLLTAGDARHYIDLVSQLIGDKEFYDLACAATRDFVASRPNEAEYLATIVRAITTIVGAASKEPPVTLAATAGSENASSTAAA